MVDFCYVMMLCQCTLLLLWKCTILILVVILIFLARHAFFQYRTVLWCTIVICTYNAISMNNYVQNVQALLCTAITNNSTNSSRVLYLPRDPISNALTCIQHEQPWFNWFRAYLSQRLPIESDIKCVGRHLSAIWDLCNMGYGILVHLSAIWDL